MSVEPNKESFKDQPSTAGTPPALPAAPATPITRPSTLRSLLAVLLNLCLVLFLADAVLAFLDDSLVLFLGTHLLTGIRTLVFFFAVLLALVVYVLMGLTPMIPKRLFLPVTLLNPAVALIAIPVLIYFYGRMHLVVWIFSLGQILFALGILYWIQSGFKFRWPLVTERRLTPRRFGWLNLSGFLLINVLVLLPLVAAYLFLCAALGVAHLSEGFLALRPAGLTVQVRSYVRDDGKTIQLIPMAHIADASFYRQVSQSFPTNATILLEGVSDHQNLLTNKISYRRAAASLGLSEQAQEFKPIRSQSVRADVDVEEFTPDTIAFLNVVMLLHAKGVNPETVTSLMLYSPPPRIEEKIFGDLLGKRNEHLLEEIKNHLTESDNLLVPWGAAHMPELARGILEAGFRLGETRNYSVIRFGRDNHAREEKAEASAQPK